MARAKDIEACIKQAQSNCNGDIDYKKVLDSVFDEAREGYYQLLNGSEESENVKMKRFQVNYQDIFKTE